MEKRFRGMHIILVEVVGEVLFVYRLLGWIYGLTIQLTHPMWLPSGLSHLTTWIRVDTFAIVSFLLSILGFFTWRLAKESAKS
jgi:hypothetical protein